MTKIYVVYEADQEDFDFIGAFQCKKDADRWVAKYKALSGPNYHWSVIIEELDLVLTSEDCDVK